jgi:tetratricopeptide (TPR) repeat protein
MELNERLFDLRERIARRWVLVLLGFVLVCGAPAVWFGPRLFSDFQRHRLRGQAAGFIAAGDPQRAVICLRRVLDLDPADVEATRSLAGVADLYAPAEALLLRERLCTLAPGSQADAEAWARLALRMGKILPAAAAFELMEKIGVSDAAHFEIGGRVAQGEGRLEEAREFFLRSLALDPANEEVQVALAAIDVRGSDPARQTAARDILERACANPRLQTAARRALIADLVAQGKVAAALPAARNLAGSAEGNFGDKLQYLDLLRATADPTVAFSADLEEHRDLTIGVLREKLPVKFSDYLRELQDLAAQDPASAAALISYLNGCGRSLYACEWAARLPRSFTTTAPVAPMFAESYRLSVAMPQLDALLAEGNWESFEYLRAAFTAYSLRRKGDRAGSSAQWAEALRLSEYRSDRIGSLTRMAGSWGWDEEWVDLLWIAANTSRRPRDTLLTLAEHYRGQRDTLKLFEVWTRLLAIDPGDVNARKHWARLSLLLKSDKLRAGTMAQQLYREQPEDPDIACTWALVQFGREFFPEALATLDRLPPDQLRSPLLAGFYGVMLVANGRRAEAAEFFARAREAPLLREERDLVDAARRTLE